MTFGNYSLCAYQQLNVKHSCVSSGPINTILINNKEQVGLKESLKIRHLWRYIVLFRRFLLMAFSQNYLDVLDDWTSYTAHIHTTTGGASTGEECEVIEKPPCLHSKYTRVIFVLLLGVVISEYFCLPDTGKG